MSNYNNCIYSHKDVDHLHNKSPELSQFVIFFFSFHRTLRTGIEKDQIDKLNKNMIEKDVFNQVNVILTSCTAKYKTNPTLPE